MTRINRDQSGFTLLEMMVVLVLVGLISAMLMQGFVYIAGVFSSVERRQQYWQQQMLQRRWLQESVRSLTNGVDGLLVQPYFFKGDSLGFSGLALQGLSYAGGVGRPVQVQWVLDNDPESNELRLMYREIKIGEHRDKQDDSPWYTIANWPKAQGAFSYIDAGEWQDSFNGRPLLDKQNRRLPELIRLKVDAGAGSFDVWIATAVTVQPYFSPGDGSEFL